MRRGIGIFWCTLPGGSQNERTTGTAHKLNHMHKHKNKCLCNPATKLILGSLQWSIPISHLCLCITNANFVICDLRRSDMEHVFLAHQDTKKVHLIFGAPVKNTVLVPKCSNASSPLNDTVLVDVEVASLQDDCDW
jgi:hypothetical protein